MAERLNKCPNCSKHWYQVLKIHNPETHDMNARATLECETCKHVWEDKVTSPYWERQKERGWVR